MAKKHTSDERIKAFIASKIFLSRYRRKVYDLRLMTAGDWSPIDPTWGAAVNAEENPNATPTSKTLEGLNDFLITEFEEGTSNEMCKAIRTLVMQTAVRFPEFEFEGDMGVTESAFNKEYLKSRLGSKPHGCAALHHMRKALLDYACGGVGWVWTGFLNDVPAMQAIDSLDVVWDQSCALVTDIERVAVEVTKPLHHWLRMFPKRYFEKFINNGDPDDRYLDRLVTLAFYYDIYGDDGTYAVLLMDGMEADEVIYKGDNPHFVIFGQGKVVFLPLKPIYFMVLPSSKQSLSIAELMLPHQMAIRSAEQTINKTVKRLVPFMQAKQGNFDKEAKKMLERGDIGGLVEYIHGAGQWNPAGEISQTLSMWRNDNKTSLVAQAGVDPYASGDKVDGISYAAEVNAIQSQSGLTRGVMASDHIRHWQECALATLANGALYDVAPISFYYSGVPLGFGLSNPISQFLRPDADLVIREDATTFESKDNKVGRAKMRLDVAIQVNTATMGMVPQAVTKEYENFLRENGETDVASYFEIPPEQMTPDSTDAGGGVESEVASSTV